MAFIDALEEIKRREIKLNDVRTKMRNRLLMIKRMAQKLENEPSLQVEEVNESTASVLHCCMNFIDDHKETLEIYDKLIVLIQNSFNLASKKGTDEKSIEYVTVILKQADELEDIHSITISEMDTQIEMIDSMYKQLLIMAGIDED